MPPRTSKASTTDSVDGFPDHPLFPVEEGEKPPHVAFIHITRKDRGVMIYGPMVRADELLSLDTIFERFGGGQYELIGRGSSVRDPALPGNVTKRKWYTIAGRSKPISQDPTADELRQAEGVPRAEAPTVAAPAAAPTGAPGETLLLALLNMQQNQAQANAEASRQFMALMMTMITDSKKESVAQMQNMSQMMMQFSQAQQQSMIAMMTTMMQSRGGGPEEMAKYAKLLKDLGIAGVKADDAGAEPSIPKMLEDAADIVTGLASLKASGVGDGNGAAVAPPPGSAAAVAAEVMPR